MVSGWQKPRGREWERRGGTRGEGKGRGGEGKGREYGRPRERTEPFEFDAIYMFLNDLHDLRVCVCKYLCDLHVFMDSYIHNDINNQNKYVCMYVYIYIYIYIYTASIRFVVYWYS